MSTTIDQSVVEMRFDNRQFEQNVSTTMSTIDKLKQSLSLTGATKGLESVGAAAKGINLSGLGTAAETVSLKFNAMWTAADTVLRNIVTRAQHAGEQIVSALTIDPIKTGFSEYETQINAVQTILANTQSKGTTLNDVNTALDTLNTYADKTIYNFTQMTRNIGTFTAAGVDLNTSVNAIQGIANLAAVSGSTSQQASTAMYQLSQALASGTVKLQDWNSVVNAGMGGQVFQDALVRTAAVMSGSAKNVEAWRKKNIDSYGSFRESLTQGAWLTTEVLTQTLSQFAGSMSEAELKAAGYTDQQIKDIQAMAQTATDAATKVKTFTQLWDTLKEAAQSGWTQTWELIIGDFEEAKEVLTKISDVVGGFINDSSTARNNLLSDVLDTNWEKLTKKINEAGIETTTFEEKVKSVMKTHNLDVDALVKKHGSLEEVFRSGAVSSDILKEAVDKLGGSLVDLSTIKEDLEKGSSGESVSKIQEALNNLGYDLGSSGVDGHFGQYTKAAVEAFQKANKLKVTGIVDEETLAALDKASKKTADLGDSCDGLISKITELGGREILIESLKNIFEGLMNIIRPIKDAFKEIFPSATASQITNAIESFNELTEKFKSLTESTKITSVAKKLKSDFQLVADTTGKVADTTGKVAEQGEKLAPIVDKIKRTFKGLFAAADIVVEVVKALAGGFFDLLGMVAPVGGGILTITANLGDWLVALRDTIKETDIFKTAIDKTVGFIKSFVEAAAKLYNTIKAKLTAPGLEQYGSLLDRIKDRMSDLGEVANNVKSALTRAFDAICTNLENSSFFDLMSALWNGVKTIGSGIASGLGSFIEVITEKLGNADFKGLLDIVNTLIAGGIGLSIKKLFDGGADAVEGFANIFDSFDDMKKGVTDVLDSVRGCFEAYQTQLKAGALQQIATAIAILAGSIILLSFVDSQKLSEATGAITMMFVDLIGALAVVDKTSINDKGLIKLAGAMVGVSIAVLILSSALKSIAELEFKQLFTGVVGIIMLTGTIVQAAKLMSSDGKTVMKGASQLILFATAIKVLASAVIDLAQLSFEQLINGLAGVAALMAGVSLFLNNTKFDGKTMSSAVGMVIFAAAIKVLASAAADFAQLSWDELIRGLVGIAGAMVAVGIAVNLMPANMLSIGIGLIGVATGMKILVSSMLDISALSWEEITKGLAAIGGAIMAIGIAMNLMPANMISIGIGLIAVAAGITIIADSVKSLSTLGWESMAIGLTALGGALVILMIGLNGMTGTLPGAAALLVASAALMALVPAMTALGEMSWESIIKGLVALAGTFAIIGVAAYLLAPATGAIMALAGSIATISLSIVGIGAGLYLIAGAFTALAVAGTAGATAIVSALTVIVTGLLGLIPAIIESLGDMIVSFCGVIADCAPAIGEAIKALVLSAIDVLVECVPPLADGLLYLIAELLTSLAEYTPQIVSGLFEFVLGLLDGLAEYIPQLIVAAMDVIGAFFQGVVDAISGIDTASLFTGIVGVGLMSGLMLALSAVASLVPGAMIGVLGMGAVIAELALVLAAIGALAQIPGLEWLIGEGGDLLATIGTAIGQFVGGIVGGLAEGVTSGLPGMGTNLSDFMTNVQPFIDGAKGLDASMLDGVRALADTILILTAADILSGITSWLTGGSTLSDFATQLVPFGEAMKGYSNAISGMDAEAVTASTTAAKALVELANNLPNSGGLVSWFTGENDMGDFATQLVPFGKAMKDYSDAIAGMDSDAVTASTTAGKALVELANNLPNEGGLVSWFTGENDISTFATKLVPFGKAMKNYSDAIAGMDADAITNSTTAGKALVELANSLPNSGGLVSWFTGDNDISAFGTGLATFGNALSNYSAAVAGVDLSAVNNSVVAARSLASVVNTLSNINTEGITSFKTAVDELAEVNIQGVAEAFSGSAEKLNGVGANIVASLVEGFSSKQDNLLKNAANLIETVLKSISSKKSLFKVVAIELMSNFINGISSQTARAERVVSSMMTGIKSVLTGNTKQFYNAGVNLVNGFAAGISASSYKAKAKARAMARAAADAAEDELDINSPSKVGEDIGGFFGMGFVNMLGEYANKAYNAGTEVAKSAKNGLGDAIGKISDMVNTDIDAQPTIRPILDLSDIRTGVGALSNMLNVGSSIGVTGNVNAIASMMNQRNQNGANDDVISAIDKLADRLDGIHGDTYQINGVTYDDGSNINTAVKTIVRAARIERRV